MLKFKEWIKRYLPSEIAGTVTAFCSAGITHLFSENLIFIAYAGSLGEAVGFYATVFIQKLFAVIKKNRTENKTVSFSDITKITANLIYEFGPAGIIDGLILRPFFMYIFPLALKNFTVGILAGKFAGDITFYILVISAYELKKHRKNQQKITDGTNR